MIKQIALPQVLREDALKAYHDSQTGGAHLATKCMKQLSYDITGVKCIKTSMTIFSPVTGVKESSTKPESQSSFNTYAYRRIV